MQVMPSARMRSRMLCSRTKLRRRRSCSGCSGCVTVMASFMPGVACSIGTMSTTSPVVMIECLSVGCELGWRNPEAALDDLAHERGGGGFMGPGFELARGLADEHLDAVDGFGA